MVYLEIRKFDQNVFFAVYIRVFFHSILDREGRGNNVIRGRAPRCSIGGRN